MTSQSLWGTGEGEHPIMLTEIFQIRIYHGYILQIFLAEVLFFTVLERRTHFWLRIILSFMVFVLLSVVVTILIYRFFP